MVAPRTKQIFISYRSNDAVKVDKIARDLSLLQYDDGTSCYIPWQDKHNLPPASPSWWDSIVEAIERCDMFVFHLSRGSLQSEVCRAELDYAYRRNRPIVPVVLEGEFFLNQMSGKYDLPKEIWALVPDWMKQGQLVFYIPTEFYRVFQTAVELFERNWPRDIPAPRPLNPDAKSVHGSNHALYSAAYDYAARLAFTEADNHFSTLLRRNDSDYADLAELWLKVIRGYSELLEMIAHNSPSVVFNRKWTAYQSLFPNEAIESVFDPKGLEQQSVSAKDSLAREKTETERLARERVEEKRRSAPSTAPLQIDSSETKDPRKNLTQMGDLQQTRTHRLIMHKGPEVGRIIEVSGGMMTIGRSGYNEINIKDPEVSLTHLRLQLRSENYWIADLGSTNGTFINGQRLLGTKPLNNGDLISLGETVDLVYEIK